MAATPIDPIDNHPKDLDTDKWLTWKRDFSMCKISLTLRDEFGT